MFGVNWMRMRFGRVTPRSGTVFPRSPLLPLMFRLVVLAALGDDLPLCLVPHAEFLVPHPDPLLRSRFWKIRGSDERLMLGVSLAVPGQVEVFADAYHPPSRLGSLRRPRSRVGVAVFQAGDVVTDYGGCPYPSKASYERQNHGIGSNQYLWESDRRSLVVDGRPDGFCLYYSSFVNEGFDANSCIFDDRACPAASTHGPRVVGYDTLWHLLGALVWLWCVVLA